MIDIYLGALFLVISFIVITKLMRLVVRGREAFAISNLVVSVLRSDILDDEEKEKALKQHTIKLFSYFFILTTGGLCALVIPVSILWLIDILGFLSLKDVIIFSLSWQFLSTVTVIFIGYFFLIIVKK